MPAVYYVIAQLQTPVHSLPLFLLSRRSVAEELCKQDQWPTILGAWSLDECGAVVEDSTKGFEALDMNETILSGNINEDVGTINKFWVVAVINDSYDYEKFL